MGTRPSQSSSHIRMFMNKSFLMKLSRLVIRRQPSRVSCTIPMTGLLAYTHILDVMAMLKEWNDANAQSQIMIRLCTHALYMATALTSFDHCIN